MKFSIEQERIYSQPIEAVWDAITDREAIGNWLMETDFEAETGRTFEMRCRNPAGSIDRYQCRVLAMEPPNSMRWSWTLEGSGSEMLVTFELFEVAEGTRLVVRHSGDLDRDAITAFEGGWPEKLEALGKLMTAS